MINNLKFTAQAETENNGKKTLVSIPSNFVLSRIGPFVQVTITHPVIYHENLKKTGKGIPAQSMLKL
jgi:hypothetical protein